MTDEQIWNDDEPIADRFDITVPEWVEQDISPYTVAAIVRGGCASGAYMPAVTCHQAAETMARHGDDVLDYIQDAIGELPRPDNEESWSGIAVFYLSYAVELWAMRAHDIMSDAAV